MTSNKWYIVAAVVICAFIILEWFSVFMLR
jgi:hypothetical protein